ncbi:hypothetical protein D3C87_1674850 [compost metagenome]
MPVFLGAYVMILYRSHRPQPEVACQKRIIGLIEIHRQACCHNQHEKQLNNQKNPVRHDVLPITVDEQRLSHPSPPDRDKNQHEFAQRFKRKGFVLYMQQHMAGFGYGGNIQQIIEELQPGYFFYSHITLLCCSDECSSAGAVYPERSRLYVIIKALYR